MHFTTLFTLSALFAMINADTYCKYKNTNTGECCSGVQITNPIDGCCIDPPVTTPVYSAPPQATSAVALTTPTTPCSTTPQATVISTTTSCSTTSQTTPVYVAPASTKSSAAPQAVSTSACPEGYEIGLYGCKPCDVKSTSMYVTPGTTTATVTTSAYSTISTTKSMAYTSSINAKATPFAQISGSNASVGLIGASIFALLGLASL